MPQARQAAAAYTPPVAAPSPSLPNSGNQIGKFNKLTETITALTRCKGAESAIRAADALKFDKSPTRTNILNDPARNPCPEPNNYLKPNPYLIKAEEDDPHERGYST